MNMNRFKKKNGSSSILSITDSKLSPKIFWLKNQFGIQFPFFFSVFNLGFKYFSNSIYVTRLKKQFALLQFRVAGWMESYERNVKSKFVCVHKPKMTY